MNKKILFPLIILPFIIQAEFNRTTGFIDTPVGYLSPQTELRIGIDGSFSLGAGDYENHPVDFDYLNVSYTLLPNLEAALTAYTVKNYVLSVKYLVLSNSQSGLDVSIGVDDITYTGDVSPVGGNDSLGDWDDDLAYPDNPAENLSIYGIMTKKFPNNIHFSLGLGRGRFVGYGPRSKLFHIGLTSNPDIHFGIFWSAFYRSGPLSYGFDFDGRDFNIGLIYDYQQFVIGLALSKVEQFLPGGHWRPRVAFGLTYKLPLEFKKINTFTLLLVDEKGSPANASVVIKDATGSVIYQGDVDGLYEMKTEYSGPATIDVRAEKYEEYSSKIEIPEGEGKEKITLKPRILVGTVNARIFDLQDNRLSTGTIVITDGSGKEVVNQQIIGKATFKLKEGDYNIKVIPGSKKYYEWQGQVSVKRKETTNLEIGLVRKKFRLILHKIEFDTGKATIKPEFYPYLDEVAKSIKMAVESNPNLLIEVQGHTDSQGSASYNLKLSQLRAEAVKNYLVTKHGINPDRLIARGYGETRPIASNSTRRGRAMNRRVEFIVLQK